MTKQLSDLTFHFHALEKEMATHSSVLAWRIPGMGEPDGLPSMGSHRVGHDWSDLAAAAGGEKGEPKQRRAMKPVTTSLLLKRMGCLSGCLVSSTSIQKLFCGSCSTFKWSFDEFVGEKVVFSSYSSTILGPSIHFSQHYNCYYCCWSKMLKGIIWG